jgi:exodeoxyribonuclease-5/deoxyribonuclease V
MILAFDTYYYDNKAKTVCVAFEHWEDSSPYKIYDEIFENIAEYVPGEFYKRELPCILSLLSKIRQEVDNIELIIVDSFVYLDDEGKLGLGGHLHNALNCEIPIIGVAKTNFATIDNLKKPIVRGDSIKPLFVTSIGIDLEKASELIQNMHGEFRLPTLLKQMDTLTKEIS